ncbi:MAG: sugar ABC transporter permease [Firmicutes bacterium]|nr:sugar ABC transporter permease [Bacillota bacterium]
MSAVVTRPTGVRTKSTLKERWANFVFEVKKNKISYLFLAPFMTLFFVFTVLPVLLSIVLSFTYFNMLEWPTWIGWTNYVRLFLADDIFLIAVQNTLVFAAITGPASYMLCLLFAWFINELQPKLRAFLTLLFYAPSISANAYMVWQIMFSGDSVGYINGQLLYWGIIERPIQWLVDPTYMMTIVIIVVLWMSLGTSFLVFIAGLQGIDNSLYEAAAIDGIRNRWQELWFVTLPVMRPYMMFGAIMAITQSFTAAGQITALTGFPPTDYATWTVMQHLQDYGFTRYEMGYASAIAFLLFATMVITQKIVQRLLQRIGQ